MSIEEKLEISTSDEVSEFDFYSFHERYAGRLIIDPVEAKIELGAAVAARLKLSEDGTKVLWPQPTDSVLDPQNWSMRRKNLQLFIVTLASIVPGFDAGIGTAAIFALARQYDTTSGVILNMTSNWSIFLMGWGGLISIMLIRRFGRLPVLFWSQLLAFGFMVGCTFAPNLKTFAAMRCLTAFFGAVPPVSGLFIVTDVYPFHLQARKLNIWAMGVTISPFFSPCAFGFLVARTSWRWAYGIGTMYSAIVVVLIVFFMEETIYDRTVRPIPEPTTTGLRYRIETLIGITGSRMQKYRISWFECIAGPFRLVWRPHLLMLLIFEAMHFGFSIGINVTNAVFLGSPPPVGYGFSQFAIAGAYGTPIVAVIVGELIGRYANDYIMNVSIKRNKGIFEAESRLWACYISMPFYICGFVTLGAAFQNHLSIGAVVMGWGMAQSAIMINTVGVFAYCSDSFPKNQGEISALIGLSRVLGGFSDPYFQVPWAAKDGAMKTFSIEAVIVTGLFLLFIPYLQWKGRELRAKYSV